MELDIGAVNGIELETVLVLEAEKLWRPSGVKLATAGLEHGEDWGVFADRIGFALHERGREAISFSKPRSDQIPTNLVKPSTHHLDPDEMAYDPDEMAAVYSTLTTVENLVEVKPAMAKMVCKRMMLLKWLRWENFWGWTKEYERSSRKNNERNKFF